MTKQEKIKEAYDLIGLPFNEDVVLKDGWLKIKPKTYTSFYESVDLLKLNSATQITRPTSNNTGSGEISPVGYLFEKLTQNGWTKEFYTENQLDSFMRFDAKHRLPSDEFKITPLFTASQPNNELLEQCINYIKNLPHIPAVPDCSYLLHQYEQR